MTHSPQHISFTAILAVALLLLAPAVGHAQTQDSTALDADCLLPSYDFSCKVGGTDKQGKPCGQGLPVASTQVKGICVASGKAEETSYENQDGQWVSGPQPNPQGAAAQTGTGISGGAAAQVTPASTLTAQPAQTAGLEPQTQTTPQASNALVPGTSVLDNSLQLLTGQESVAPPGGASNISPSDNENTIFNPQPLSEQPILPGGQAQALTSEPVAPGGATVPDTTYAPGVQSTLSEPMGSLQGLTQQDVQSANSTANPSLFQQVAQDFQYFQNSFSSQQAPLDTSDVRATIYTPGAGGDNGGLYGSQGNLLNPNVPTVAAGYDSGYQYGQVLNITNPDTNQSVNAVVGDVCPGCKSGIDLTPAAANAIGFTQEQGVGTMQVAVVANTPNYSDGSQMTVALNQNPNALNPWNAPPVVSLNTYVSQDFAALTTPDWVQTSLEPLPGSPVAPVEQGQDLAEPAQPYPTVAVQAGANLPEPVVPVEPNAEPYPTVAVQTGPALPEPAVPVEPNAEPYPTQPVASAPLPLSNEQIASYVPVPEAFATNPQLAIEQANNEAINQQLPTPELVDTNPQAAIEQANNEALNQQLPTPQPVDTNPQVAIEQANNQALNEQLPAPSPVQTNPQAAIEQANNETINQQLPTPEPVETNPQAAVEAANQQALQQIPQPDYVNITPEQIAAEVAQSNPLVPNDIVSADFNSVAEQGLTPQQIVDQEFGALPQAPNVLGEVPAATNPVFASYDSSGFTEQDLASSFNPVQQSGEDITQQVAAQNAADQAQSVQEITEGNPFDSSGQVVTLTCSGGGGVCGQDNTTAAPGGAPLTGATDAVAVPKDNPYGLQIGDTVSVQVGGTVVQNVPVTDYTQTGSDNYVVSGALENQLGGTGSDAALITPTPAPQPLPGSAPAGQGGIGSDYVSPQVTPAETISAPGTPLEVLQGGPPLSAADLFPGENAAAWSEVALNDQAYNPSQDESLAYGGEQTPAPGSTQEQTGSAPTGAASDIASANPNDERLQPAQDQSEPETVIPPPTPMQSMQSKLNNALNYVQQAQTSASNGGSNNLTQQQYNYLRSVAAATGNADSVPSYQDAASKFNSFGGWMGIAGSSAIWTIQNAISGLKK